MKQFIFILLAIVLVASCTADSVSSADEASPSQTLSGSYAKILQIDNAIYAIDQSRLTTFKVTADGVDKIDDQDVGFNIENIYNHQNFLFIGSQTGMFIYEILSNGVPARQNVTSYEIDNDVFPCDPVISDGVSAYVTLNTSTNPDSPCFRNTPINQLRIYDIANIYQPELISITNLEGPKGIGVKGNHLFVCDGNSGFKVIDITDKREPVVINRIGEYKAFDLIINEDKLSVIGENELVQYDITDINNIKKYSTIILGEK